VSTPFPPPLPRVPFFCVLSGFAFFFSRGPLPVQQGPVYLFFFPPCWSGRCAPLSGAIVTHLQSLCPRKPVLDNIGVFPYGSSGFFCFGFPGILSCPLFFSYGLLFCFFASLVGLGFSIFSPLSLFGDAPALVFGRLPLIQFPSFLDWSWMRVALEPRHKSLLRPHCLLFFFFFSYCDSVAAFSFSLRCLGIASPSAPVIFGFSLAAFTHQKCFSPTGVFLQLLCVARRFHCSGNFVPVLPFLFLPAVPYGPNV